MKQLYKSFTTLFLFIFFSFSSFSQVTYVNLNASGAGDGSSWADAYTDLQAALTATADGQVWIAAGVYTPTSLALDTFNTFLVEQEISIYGGFAGDEATIEERDLGANTTTLSGDLNGDDVDNNFTMNKEDNVFHVLTLSAANGSVIVIDGITVTGGNTREASDNTDYSWRGGGIFSYNTVEIANCNFNNNFARSGGAVYLSPEFGGGNNSKIENCTFTKNSCFSQAAGVYLNQVNDVTVSGCTFESNSTNRGALYPFSSTGFLIENCNFVNNSTISTDNFGGSLFIWASKGLVQGCNFVNNSAGNGAAFYIDDRDAIDPSADDVTFENCNFSANTALAFGGGAIRSFTASYSITNSQFSNNTASNGGAIFASGNGTEIMSMNNTFQGNTADFGGCQANYGDFANYTMINNTYIGNAANTSGGALINGFGSNVVVDNCEFISNIAGFGGAMFCQNDTTNVEVYNSTFSENSVGDGSGGAINLSGPVTLTVDNSRFESNVAGFGGAINGSQGTDVDLIEGFVKISNSIIQLNTVSSQGAGISLVDLDLTMTSTVLGTNFNTGAGAGGGISINTTANKSATYDITNSTFANNFAILGSGISAFTEDETSECIINLHNNIFSNEGINYEIEAGTPTVNSLGGNISTDASLEGILTGPGDVNDSEDILFLDAANNDFQIENNSPAINIGVTDGAPETDILGNPRVDAPDAGAYENQDPLSIEVVENSGQMTLSPNPAETYTRISLSNDWTGMVNISILDQSGKLIQNSIKVKTGQDVTYEIPTNQLTTGNYILTVQANNQKIASQFIKI
ncbi:MAG: choice-of-anchor Q domain-containing protein [Saprospiraceae bacterium]|nr:choice-of-anchor Q domain-containing protein [Saprospiraceae bacterium]